MSRRWTLGFLAAMVLFAAINLAVYAAQFGPRENGGVVAMESFDSLDRVGWPFPFYESGTMMHVHHVTWSGLGADLVIAVVSSTGVASAFARMERRRERQS